MTSVIPLALRTSTPADPEAAPVAGAEPAAAPVAEPSPPRHGSTADREAPGTLGRVVALVEPELAAHRAVLILGLVALVLSTWMLVALPVPLKHSIDAALAVAGVQGIAPDGNGSAPGVALLSAAGGLVAVVALQAGLRILSVVALHRAGGRMATDLRARLLDHHHRGGPDHDADGRSISAALVEDVARVQDLVAHHGPRLLGGALSLASLLGVLLVIEPIAAAIVVVAGGLQALLGIGALRARRRREAAVAADEAELVDTADELLTASRTIRSFGLEQRVEHSLRELGSRAARSRSAARRSRAVDRGLAELVTGLGVGVALLVGGGRMAAGTMTPGELTMAIAYVVLSTVLVREVVGRAASLTGLGPARDRMAQLLEHPLALSEPRPARPLGRLRGELALSALSIAGPHDMLCDSISLEIPAGQHVALVGREGSEASALFSCLQGFDEPRSGRVLVDRIDARDPAPRDLRRQLAVVQREAVLFTDTVRENLRRGRPEASDEEIVDAARRSGADEFITLLPEGYDTPLTRDDAALTDGQRRRLAITRALLRDAPVVMLDGADDGLVPAERDSVRRALATLTAGRTALISSRDPETVLAADRVVCFESGALVEDGVPSRLAEDPDSWLSSWILTTDLAGH